MSNFDKHFSDEIKSTFVIAGVVIVLFIFFFVGTFIAMIVAIDGGIFGAYKIYEIYTNDPATQAAQQRQIAEQTYREAVSAAPRAITRDEFGNLVARHLRGSLPDSVGDCMRQIAKEIYDRENFAAVLPPPPAVTNAIEVGRYKDQLARFANFGDADLRQAAETIGRAFYNCLDDLPAIEEGESDIAIPLSTYFPDLADSIEYLIFPFFDDETKRLFPRMRAELDRHYNEQKGVLPTKYRGDDVIRAYVGGTCLEKLFHTPIQLDIPERVKYEHAVITGGTGHGKTTLLENLLLKDLNNYNYPSIVVIDSQQQLIEKLSHLAEVHGRNLIIIDPKDSPALNVFDLNTNRIGRYDAIGREQILNNTLETFSYLFDALLGADLTVKQTTLFNYIIMLMLAMPAGMGRTATLFDLIELTEHPERYAGAIEQLSPVAKGFFQTDFMQTQYRQTKEQIRYRLHAILGNPTLSRLFLAPRNTIDFYEELGNGAIILINTDKTHLGATNSSYLGRITITFILQAILERGANPDVKHNPVHIYIDEAAEYFDRSVERFLTEARKHLCGITMAHQQLGGTQMTAEFRASVLSNTGTKYAGGVSAQDARTVASDMRTEPQFILSQPRLRFACHIRNVTPEAVSVPVTVGLLDKEPKVSEAEYQAFRARNRARLAVPETAAPPASASAQPKSQPPPAPQTSPKSDLDYDPTQGTPN